MRILGIDPGLATMGYGVIEAEGQKRKVVQFGTINTRAGSPTPQRLRSIFQGVNQLLDIYAPDDVAFEELFFSKNVTTGIAVAQARGAALDVVAFVEQHADDPGLQVARVPKLAALLPALAQGLLHGVLAVAGLRKLRVADAVQRLGHGRDALCEFLVRHGPQLLSWFLDRSTVRHTTPPRRFLGA